MGKKIKSILASILMLILTVSLVACGNQSSGDNAKTLTVGVISVGDQPFDAATVSLEYVDQVLPIYDSLIRVDEKGKYVPNLAQSWTLTDDKLTMTMKLREGVKFQDGSTFTSADVKFTLEYYMSDDSKQSDKNLMIEYIKDITAPDDNTVVIHFNEPCTEFEYLFSEAGTGTGIIMPKTYFEKVGAEGFAKKPIGTGPFKLSSFSAGNEIVYTANEDYWQGAPDVKKLVYRQISQESTRVTELQAGNIDFAPISASSKSLFGGNQNINIKQVEYNSTLGIFVAGAYNNTGKATQNNLVREALKISINRNELVKNMFEGDAIAASAWGIFPFTEGYGKERPSIEFNQEKAKKLLKDAGYPEKFSDPVIKIYDAADKVYTSEVVQAVAAYWQAIGLQVKIVSTDAVSLDALSTADVLSDEFVGAVYLFDPPKKYSAHDVFYPFYPSDSYYKLIPNDEELDRQITSLASVNGAEKADTVSKILDTVDKADVAIPLVYPGQDYAVSTKVTSWDSNYGGHWGDWFYKFVLK